MQSRILWLLFAAIVLVGATLGLRDCQRQAPPAHATATTAPADAGSTSPTDPASAAEATKLRARMQQREDAMSVAVATLHQYLAALSDDDRAKADAFWANGHPPADSGEADLRTLKDVLSLRIQNRAPKPLDSEPVPAALEIPVELRASVEGQALRRYRGWYRMRHAGGDRWKITSASIDLEQRPE